MSTELNFYSDATAQLIANLYKRYCKEDPSLQDKIRLEYLLEGDNMARYGIIEDFIYANTVETKYPYVVTFRSSLPNETTYVRLDKIVRFRMEKWIS